MSEGSISFILHHHEQNLKSPEIRACRTDGQRWSTVHRFLRVNLFAPWLLAEIAQAHSEVIANRPGVWLLGIVGTVATAYVTAALTDLTKPLPRYVSQLACSWAASKTSPDEPKFTILVSRLYEDDADGLQTRRLLEASQGSRSFDQCCCAIP